MAWIWWLGAALVLGVAEMLSLDFFILMLAGGALGGMVAALLGAPLWVQILAFAATSVLLVFAVRPWMLRRLRDRMPLVETNAAALVGKTGVVVADVSDRGGRIKLSGEVWTARTRGDEVVAVGQDVRVLALDGATAVVTRHIDAQPTYGAGAGPAPTD
jgi:membrane protein implicated in regulation of membrane protease activity